MKLEDFKPGMRVAIAALFPDVPRYLHRKIAVVRRTDEDKQYVIVEADDALGYHALSPEHLEILDLSPLACLKQIVETCETLNIVLPSYSYVNSVRGISHRVPAKPLLDVAREVIEREESKP